MYLLIVFSFLFSFSSHAEHMIRIGTNGFGFDAGAQVFKTKSELEVDKFTLGISSVAFDYSYVFSSRVMLGASLATESQESELKLKDGTKVKAEENTTSLALSLGYNFNDEFERSWWIKAYLGQSLIKESAEYSSSPEDNVETENSSSFFALSIGKRFLIAKNIMYSPSIDLVSATFDGDLKDSGVEGFSGLTINFINLDILF